MQKGTQHWLPRSYLAAWCDPDRPPIYDPYVWCFPKVGGTGKPKSPENLFSETDFYTIQLQAGERDLSLEEGLGILEGRFDQIRKTRIDKREPLTTEEKVWLAGFVAAMHWRTRAQRDAFQQQWQHVVRVAEDLQQGLDQMTPEERQSQRPMTTLGSTTGPSLTVDDARRLAEKPLQHMLLSAIEEDLAVLARMNLVVFTTESDPGFITSDHPCTYFDPHGGRRPAMLRSRSVQVTLPVSSNSLALLCWEDFPPYKPMTSAEVDNANRLQQMACDNYVVVRRNEFNPVWLT